MDLNKLADLAESGDTEALLALASEPDVAAGPSPAPAPAEPEPEDNPEDEPHTAVATKTGQGTIPYAVLKGAREQAAELARQNELLKSQLDDLTTRRADPEPSPQPAAATPDAMEAKIAGLRERAEALAEDFPELAASLTENADLLSAMREQLAGVIREREADKEATAAVEGSRVRDEVQDAIDATPALAMWQSNHPDVFAEAVDLDGMLRGKPEWQGRPMTERFAKVVAMVQVMRPDAPSLPIQAPAPARAPSLSDIPGGMVPSTSFSEQVDQISAAALGNKFANMTSDQINEYLMNLQ